MHTLLGELFRGKPDDEYILVWTSNPKLSYWFNHTDMILPDHFSRDTYFGLGTSPKNFGTKRRCPADKITGIGALWLDVDIAGPAHKKSNIPATEAEATTLLAKAFPDLIPSYIIHSGHGLQIYYLLDNWLQITDDNREQVKTVLQGFSAIWREACKAEGYDADSVFDLARVMRLPGTVNIKIKEDIKTVVELKASPDIRYTFDQIKALVESIKVEQQPKPKPKTEPKPVEVLEAGKIDRDKWDALCMADLRVEQTWNQDRPDLQDQSPSSYTMSLGRLVYNAGWSDQEIFNLLVAFRQKIGAEIKEHAIKLTIQKYHSTPSEGVVRDDKEPESKEQTKESSEEQATEEISREDKFKKLSAGLDLPVKSITRFEATPPEYTLTMNNDIVIALGTIEGITDQKRFRNAVAAAAGILPKKFKPDAWDNAVRFMLSLCDYESAGPEATEAGQAIEWIQAYLHAVTIHSTREDGLLAGEPWTEADTVHIIATALRSWISVNLGDKIPARKLSLILKSLKAEPCTVASGDSKRSAWRIPQNIWRAR